MSVSQAAYDAMVARILDLETENARLLKACASQNEEICQTLGSVLGYPRLKDDQKNFPGATEADGVCVGEHVAETLVAEAATALKLAHRELIGPWPYSPSIEERDRQEVLARLGLIEARTATREMIDICSNYLCCCEPGDKCYHLTAKGRAALKDKS